MTSNSSFTPEGNGTLLTLRTVAANLGNGLCTCTFSSTSGVDISQCVFHQDMHTLKVQAEELAKPVCHRRRIYKEHVTDRLQKPHRLYGGYYPYELQTPAGVTEKTQVETNLFKAVESMLAAMASKPAVRYSYGKPATFSNRLYTLEEAQTLLAKRENACIQEYTAENGHANLSPYNGKSHADIFSSVYASADQTPAPPTPEAESGENLAICPECKPRHDKQYYGWTDGVSESSIFTGVDTPYTNSKESIPHFDSLQQDSNWDPLDRKSNDQAVCIARISILICR
jgi:hypothetical protein